MKLKNIAIIVVLFLRFGSLGFCQEIKAKTDIQQVCQNEANQISSLIKSKASIEKIKPLLSKQNINVIDSTGHSLLSNAIRSKNVKLSKILLEFGANPNLQNKDFLRSSLLMQCTITNLLEVAKLLLESGADINYQDKQKDPAIHWSAYYGQLELTKLFLEKGANPNLKSIHSDGVMHVALKEWQEKVVDLLLEYDVNIHDTFPEDEIIFKAINSGSLEKVKLLNNRLNVNAIDASGTPILVKAASIGNIEIVNYLLENNANINAMNPTGHTALNRAIFFGHNEIAKKMIAFGADVSETDKRFKLPPIIAAIRGNNLIMGKLLIANSANINTKDGINGMTPIMWAVAYQNLDFVQLILSQNPDLTIVSNNNGTVFTLVTSNEISRILKKRKEKNKY